MNDSAMRVLSAAVIAAALLSHGGPPIARRIARADEAAPEPAEGILGPLSALVVADAEDVGAAAVAALGRHVYIWAPGTFGSGKPRGVLALDRPVSALAREGQLVWAATMDGSIASIDVADSEQPRVVGRLNSPLHSDMEDDVGYARSVGYGSAAIVEPGVLWRMGWTVEPIGVRLERSWIVDASDVRDPAEPRLASRLVQGTGSGGIAMDGSRAVVAAARWVGPGVARHTLTVLDVSNVRSPRVAATVPLDEAPLSAAVHGPIAWVVLRTLSGGDVRVFDIAEPDVPRAIGAWPESWDQIVALSDGLLLRRGSELARADVSDPLAPRIRSHVEIDGVVGLERSGRTVLARLADGALAVIVLDESGGPRLGARVASGHAVAAVHGAGERLIWRDGASWRLANAERPARVLRQLSPGAGHAATAGGIAWLATADAVHPVDLATGAPAGATVPSARLDDMAAEDKRLWVVSDRGRRLTAWNASDPLAPVIERQLDLRLPVTLADRSAASGQLLVADRMGLVLIDPSASDAQRTTQVVSGDDIDAFGWDGQTIAVGRGAALEIYAVVPGRAAESRGRFDLDAPVEALLIDHGRLYVLGGGALDVFDVAASSPRWVARAPAPFGVRSLAIAGDRLMAALGNGGLTAWRLPAPERPIILERCGTTLQDVRTLAVAAAGATTVTLRVDGLAVGDAVPSTTERVVAPVGVAALAREDVPVARFGVALSNGQHELETLARAPGQPERTSEPVHLTVDRTLAFDPLGTVFEDGVSKGPVAPYDADGCIGPADGWSVALDPRRAIAVRVPVRLDLAERSSVRVAIGDRTAALMPTPEVESNVVVFGGTVPPAEPGVLDRDLTVRIAIDVDGALAASWEGKAVAPRVWLPWAGR